MEKMFNDLLEVSGVKGVIFTSKDGLNMMGDVKSEDVEAISAIISAIFGGAEELEKIMKDKVEYVIVGGTSSKIMLFNCKDVVIGVIGDVLMEEIKEKILKCYS